MRVGFPISPETLQSSEWTASKTRTEAGALCFSPQSIWSDADRTSIPWKRGRATPKGWHRGREWDVEGKEGTKGGPMKVRPRAELVCRKRRFPANALVSTPVSFVPPHTDNGIVHPSGPYPRSVSSPRAFKPCGAPFRAATMVTHPRFYAI